MDSDFHLQLEFSADDETLYRQFATAEGVRNWWTECCTLDEQVGGGGRFDFPGSDFFAEVQIEELTPPRVVQWVVTDSKHPDTSEFDNLRDWIGTRIRFEIEPTSSGDSTLRFSHRGLLPLECAEVCSNTWHHFLAGSLRKYFETGKGTPHPAKTE